MGLRKRLFAIAAGLGVVASALGVTAAPSALADNPLCVMPMVGSTQYTFCGTGVVQVVPIGSNEANVEMACTTFVENTVLDTEANCWAQGTDGTRINHDPVVWFPGSVAVAQGSEPVTVPLQTYQLCFSSDFIDLNGNRASGSNTGAVLVGCIAAP
jgi:hypothetical protein